MQIQNQQMDFKQISGQAKYITNQLKPSNLTEEQLQTIEDQLQQLAQQFHGLQVPQVQQQQQQYQQLKDRIDQLQQQAKNRQPWNWGKVFRTQRWQNAKGYVAPTLSTLGLVFAGANWLRGGGVEWTSVGLAVAAFGPAACYKKEIQDWSNHKWESVKDRFGFGAFVAQQAFWVGGVAGGLFHAANGNWGTAATYAGAGIFGARSFESVGNFFWTLKGVGYLAGLVGGLIAAAQVPTGDNLAAGKAFLAVALPAALCAKPLWTLKLAWPVLRTSGNMGIEVAKPLVKWNFNKILAEPFYEVIAPKTTDKQPRRPFLTYTRVMSALWLATVVPVIFQCGTAAWEWANNSELLKGGSGGVNGPNIGNLVGDFVRANLSLDLIILPLQGIGSTFQTWWQGTLGESIQKGFQNVSKDVNFLSNQGISVAGTFAGQKLADGVSYVVDLGISGVVSGVASSISWSFTSLFSFSMKFGKTLIYETTSEAKILGTMYVGFIFTQIYGRRILEAGIDLGKEWLKTRIGKKVVHITTQQNIPILSPCLRQIDKAYKWMFPVQPWDLPVEHAYNPEVQKQLDLIVQVAEKIDSNSYASLPNVLLEGDPGTGKTSFAKTLRDRLGWNYISWTGDELGQFIKDDVAISKLNELLDKAENARGRTIIFIDEVEIFATKLERLDEKRQALLKAFLGRVGRSKKVMIVAATNRVKNLDAAFLSRMNYSIYVGYPDYTTRVKILQQYADRAWANKYANGKIFEPEHLDFIARRTYRVSGRTLEQLIDDLQYKAWRWHDEKKASQSQGRRVEKIDWEKEINESVGNAVKKDRLAANSAGGDYVWRKVASMRDFWYFTLPELFEVNRYWISMVQKLGQLEGYIDLYQMTKEQLRRELGSVEWLDTLERPVGAVLMAVIGVASKVVGVAKMTFKAGWWCVTLPIRAVKKLYYGEVGQVKPVDVFADKTKIRHIRADSVPT